MLVGLVPFRTIQARSLHTALRLAGGGWRSDGWWIKDHKPDVFPRNEEDKRRAALKYGLRFEDYKALESKEDSLGDYPELGYGSFDHKDPYENWSHPWHRRNFNEPVPVNWDVYRNDRASFTGFEEELFNTKMLIFKCVAWFTGFGLFVYWGIVRSDINIANMRFVNLKKVKQYAYDYHRALPFGDPEDYPITNYTFEPDTPSHH